MPSVLSPLPRHAHNHILLCCELATLLGKRTIARFVLCPLTPSLPPDDLVSSVFNRSHQRETPSSPPHSPKREPHLPVHRLLPSILGDEAPLLLSEALPTTTTLGLGSCNVSLSAQPSPPTGGLLSLNAVRFPPIPTSCLPELCPPSQQDTEDSGNAHQPLLSPPTQSF